MQNKKTLIAGLLVGIFSLILLFFFLVQNRQASPPQGEKLRIVAVQPNNLAPDYLYSPSLQVVVTFNQSVALEKLYYSFNPPLAVTPRAASEGRQVILSPDGPWPEGNFSLTISKKTLSATGRELDRDYLYQFRVGFETGGAD